MNPYHYDTPHRECQAAHRIRAAELDAWLEEIGARVIHVTDLGAAMEAAEWGRSAFSAAPTIQGCTTGPPLLDYRFRATRAAHLARRALGES